MIARVRAEKPLPQDYAETAVNYFARPKDPSKFISSGCTTLDLALGGGWARRRVSNIVGDKSTGKTLLCIEACANFARIEKKGKIRYREAEAAFDEPYAGALGMPLSRVDFGGDKPLETVEDLFEDLTKIIEKARTPELVVVDSLDALSDREEMQRPMDKGTYGAKKAKNLSELFRRLNQSLSRTDVTLMVVSQIRDKINTISFGRNTTRSGGRALDFYASQVLYLAHIGRLAKTVFGQKRATGVTVKGKVDKNKVGLAFREAEFNIRFGYGIDDGQACVDFLKESNYLKQANLNAKDVPDYLSYLQSMTVEEERTELARLRELVAKRWYEVDSKLLVPRSKYA